MNNPPWNPKKPLVPIDKDGNVEHYPTYQSAYEILWPFIATMEIDGMTSGRSAKYLNLTHVKTGKSYPMFVSDLVKGIQDGTVEIKDARLTALWAGSKKGANYGIKSIAGEM